jgi:hypothetical protein
MLLVKITFSPCTCNLANRQATLWQCVRTFRVKLKEIYWVYWRKTNADTQSLFQKHAKGKVTEGKYLARLFENFARNASKYEASPQEAAPHFKHLFALKVRTINAVSNSEEKDPIVRCY